MTEQRAGSVVKADAFFVARYQRKLGEIRASIAEIEALATPLRLVVADADRRLAVLRQTEQHYMEALDA